MADANSQPSFDKDQDNEHGIEHAKNGRKDSDTTRIGKALGLIQQVVPKPEISPQARKGKHSRDKLAKATPQLRFITTTNPEQDKDPQTRKAVRSHVARQFHVVRQQAWKDEEELQGRNQSQSPAPNAENAVGESLGRISRTLSVKLYKFSWILTYGYRGQKWKRYRSYQHDAGGRGILSAEDPTANWKFSHCGRPTNN
jgi:hypothetical protein